MKKYEENMKKIRRNIYMEKYEGNMKEYEQDMKDIWRNMKIRNLPIYGPWDLEEFWAHPPISEGGGRSQFPDLGVPQRKDM